MREKINVENGNILNRLIVGRKRIELDAPVEESEAQTIEELNRSTEVNPIGPLASFAAYKDEVDTNVNAKTGGARNKRTLGTGDTLVRHLLKCH